MRRSISASRIKRVSQVWHCCLAFLFSAVLLTTGCFSVETPPVAPPTQPPPQSPSPPVPTIAEEPPATANTTTMPAPPSAPEPPAPATPEPLTPAPAPRPVSLFTPLMDMTAADRYKGEDGGLYGGGLNGPPDSHREAALKALAEIRPLDASGAPSPEGKIVLVSIGMSNATQEFSFFKKLADADPEKSPNLTIVDGAQGGQTALIWATQERPWQVLAQRLSAAGVTPQQVQVIWAKQANARPTGDFLKEAQALMEQLGIIMRRVKERYPNAKVVYLSSRTYGGYATTPLNPEPYAYESAFAIRWLIQSQMDGDSGLNFDPGKGPAVSPLLLWGPYLWADGANPRSDGLIWERDDFVETDRTHPSNSGRTKTARMLLDFFMTDELAKSWFVKAP